MLEQVRGELPDYARRSVCECLLITLAFLSAPVGCVTLARNVSSSPQYSSVPTEYCKVAHAWDLSGNTVVVPAVVTCAVALYPPELRAAGREGEVIVRMVVDGAGIPDSPSIRVIRSNGGRAFERAVLAASKYMRFAPGGRETIRPVVVEMPTSFTITH